MGKRIITFVTTLLLIISCSMISFAYENVGSLTITTNYENMIFKIYKVANNTHVLLKEVTDYNESINVCDYNIFNYDEVEYYITNQEDLKITDSIKIRPKDYLINKLNNELLSTKKKWCV